MDWLWWNVKLPRLKLCKITGTITQWDVSEVSLKKVSRKLFSFITLVKLDLLCAFSHIFKEICACHREPRISLLLTTLDKKHFRMLHLTVYLKIPVIHYSDIWGNWKKRLITFFDRFSLYFMNRLSWYFTSKVCSLFL